MNCDRIFTGRCALAALGALASLLLTSCEFGTAPGLTLQAPRIAYVTPVCDTVDRAATHSVQSTGGSVTLYTVTPALPTGYTLDSLTGRITGTPVTAHSPIDYTVIATGPDGADTAVIRMWATAPFSSGGTPGGSPGVPAVPSVDYLSPFVDTVGRPASHPAYSLGGTVTSYALLDALPAGLSLNASTGTLSGSPTTVTAFTDYRIVATSPGGKDTVLVHLAVVQKPAQQSSALPPRIEYPLEVFDTVGMPASHPVASLGGKVTSYAVISVGGSDTALPKGLKLNGVTGLISGTPEMPEIYYLYKGLRKNAQGAIVAPTGGYTSVGGTYSILAAGPGGKDTASITIQVVWYIDAPQGPGNSSGSGINLTVNLGNGTSPVVLAKSSVLTLKKMVITLTSSVSTDAVVRDTILAGTNGFSGSLNQAKATSKFYTLKPLRNWSVNVRTLDVRDSTVHEGSSQVNGLLVGEKRSVTIDAQSHYDTYEVRIAFPDSLGSSTGSFKQVLKINRIRISLDGIVIRDTTKAAGYFAASPTSHSVEYDYVLSSTHLWAVAVYGDLPGWDASRPLFTGSISLPLSSCAACNSSSTITMIWTGPGSPSDPNFSGTAGAPVTTLPTVYLVKTNIVVITGDSFGIGGPIPKRAAQ